MRSKSRRSNPRPEGQRGHGAAGAGAHHVQLDDAVLGDLQQLDVAAIGLKSRPDLVQHLLDGLNRISCS